ncbi:MAG: AMP-binding protein [Candidatus Nanopelagicales bacterium]
MGNLADLVRDAAAARAAHPALVSTEEQVTWRELDQRVERAAREFAALMPTRGTRVALMMTNRVPFVVAYFAVLRAGLVAVPINPGYTVPEISTLLADSQAEMLLHEQNAPQPEELVAAFPQLRVIALDSPAGDRFAGLARGLQGVSLPASTPARTLAVLMYTSGSEGRPKGAMLSHGALLANAEALARLRNPAALEPDDRLLLVLPIFHIFGLNGGLGLVAKKAATCVLLERFEPRSALETVSRFAVTTVAGAPQMYRAWVDQEGAREALSRIRLFISGASPLSAELFEHFRAVIGQPIWEGYGLTECSPVVTSSLVSGVPKAGSVGRPVSGLEVSLRDHDGQPAEAGDPGEVWVRGRSLFSGYWPDGSGGPDATGWFATGDVALIDEEGDFQLVDRSHDLIIVSGFNVYPREVEDVLAAHPAVAEVAVVGVPNPKTGEAVSALVVLHPGVPEPTDLASFCEARLARFKCPATITFVDSLPRAATGKLARRALRSAPQ